jgi:Zn-dependent M32 family carboxypeptidase
MNLSKYDVYMRLLIDGMPSPVFSATTLPPLRDREKIEEEQGRETILRVSREKYAKPRSLVEGKIAQFAKKVIQEEKVWQEEKAKRKI